IMGTNKIGEYLEKNMTPQQIEAQYAQELAHFKQLRQQYLIYHEQPYQAMAPISNNPWVNPVVMPTAAKPAVAKPVAVKSVPLPAKPVAAKPVAVSTLAAKPAVAKPVAGSTVSGKPAVAKPVVASPTAVPAASVAFTFPYGLA
ncbi:hypothetical protein MXD81_10225, partial [Microbacteriaceae bacterium K1510]|nr:hypothetical protein [Microbacteriaceae bacterium K1510]